MSRFCTGVNEALNDHLEVAWGADYNAKLGWSAEHTCNVCKDKDVTAAMLCVLVVTMNSMNS